MALARPPAGGRGRLPTDCRLAIARRQRLAQTRRESQRPCVYGLIFCYMDVVCMCALL